MTPEEEQLMQRHNEQFQNLSTSYEKMSSFLTQYDTYLLRYKDIKDE